MLQTAFAPPPVVIPRVLVTLANDNRTVTGSAPAGWGVQISLDGFVSIAVSLTADVNGSFGYIFATALAGVTLSARAFPQTSVAVSGSQNLYPVAGRLFVPHQSMGTSNTDVLALTRHPMFDAINGIVEIQWANWRATTGAGSRNGGAAEIAPGAAATGTANVTYIDAATLKFVTVNMTDATSGSTNLTAPDGGNFIARATINNLAGSDIYPKIAAHFPNGGVYCQGPLDVAGGDRFQYGSSPIPLTNTPTNTYAADRGYYGPCMIRAVTAVGSVGVCGDSRNSALADVPNDRYGNIGQIGRLAGKRLPVVNVSVPGETAADFALASQSPRRRALLGMARSPRIFIPLGTNDIVFQGAPAAGTKTYIDGIASDLGKTPIYVTIDPATTGGITTPARPAAESARNAFNATVRAQTAKYDPASVLENGTTGAWANAAYVSADYTHESNVGNQYAADNAGFDFALLGSPAVLDLGIAYPDVGLYQSLALADGWVGQGAALTLNNLYSPEHKVSAALITEDGATSTNHGAYKQVPLAIAQQTRTFTFYAKRVAGARNIMFQAQRSDDYSDARTTINLGTGAVIYSSATSGATIGAPTITLVAGYYKVVVPITWPAGAPANPYLYFKAVDASGADAINGDGTSSIAVWGLDVR